MELAILNNEQVPVTTSKKVAEYFGRQHAHVMETIRTIIRTAEKYGQGDLSDFREVSYKDEGGRTYPLFEMTEDGFLTLVLGFTGKKATSMRIDFVKAFQAMREELDKRDTLPDLGDPNVLRGLLLDYTEKVQELEHKVTEMEPKAETYDGMMGTDGLVNLTVGLKSVGLKPRYTMEWMRDNGYLYKNKSGENIATQRYVDKGLFVVKPVYNPKNSKNATQTFLTPKGLEHFYKKREARKLSIYCYGVKPYYVEVAQ